MAVTSAPTTAQEVEAYGPVGRSAWLDVDWRAHQRWVTIKGNRINLIELGEGPPIVFIHGLGGTWRNWLENIPEFARDHRVIAFDLPGFGASPLCSDPISIPGYTAIVTDLLAELGVESAVIVGNSMGGFIAADLAIEQPTLVSKLVLVSAAGLSVDGPREERLLAGLRRLERAVLVVAEQLAVRSRLVASRPRLRRAALSLVVAFPERLPAPLVFELLQGSSAPGAMAALESVIGYDYRDRVPAILCPTFLVWGTRDMLVPSRSAEAYEELLIDVQKVKYRGTAHLPQLERPARFNADVRAFLSA